MALASLIAALLLRGDPELASLRDEIVGKRIWLYGATIACGRDQTAMWDPREPVTVLGVKREPDRFYESHGGKREGLLYHAITPWNTGGNWGPVIPWIRRTIQIEVRLPKGRIDGLGDSMLIHPFEGRPYGDHKMPLSENASFTVASRDELWRFATPVSPWEMLSQTSEKVRNAFARRDLAIGMPRGLVAFVLADPDPGAPRPEVWRRRDWTYDGGTLDSYFVVFDANDRVANFGVDWAKWP